MTYSLALGACVGFALAASFLRPRRAPAPLGLTWGMRDVAPFAESPLGGSPRPVAYVNVSPADDGASTAPIPVPISSRPEPGEVWAGAGVHPTHDPWSRRVVPIDYGGPRVAPGGETGRTPPGRAA